jgi:hypothetical protein
MGCKHNKEKTDNNIADFLIEETGYEWNWSAITRNKVILINSMEEFEKYIAGTGTLPDIEFSQKTMLLAYGKIAGIVDTIHKQLQSSEDGCFLNVEIVKYDVLASGIWLVSILTDKIENAEIIIKLSEQIKSGEPPLKPDYRDKWCGEYKYKRRDGYNAYSTLFGKITKYPFDSLTIEINPKQLIHANVDELGIIRSMASQHPYPYTQIGQFITQDSLAITMRTGSYPYYIEVFGKKIK